MLLHSIGTALQQKYHKIEGESPSVASTSCDLYPPPHNTKSLPAKLDENMNKNKRHEECSATNDATADEADSLATGESAPASFFKLPPELFQHIATLLPLTSAVSLTLCSRATKNILGTKYFEKINEQQHGRERKQFLLLLADECPLHYYCHSSKVIHKCPLQSYRWQGTRHCSDYDELYLKDGPFKRALLGCVPARSSKGRDESHVEYQLFTSFFIRFSHVQLVMKQHRLGPEHGKPVDYLSFGPTIAKCSLSLPWNVRSKMKRSRPETTPERGNAKAVRMSCSEARIIDGEVFQRTQQWFLVPSEYACEANLEKICHLCLHGYEMVQVLVKQAVGELETLPQSLAGYWCCDCGMDFEVHARDLGDQGFLLIVVHWVRLGHGITPYDPRWQLQIRGSISAKLEMKAVEFACGETRFLFETAEGSPLDDEIMGNGPRLMEWCEANAHYPTTSKITNPVSEPFPDTLSLKKSQESKWRWLPGRSSTSAFRKGLFTYNFKKPAATNRRGRGNDGQTDL